jgi:hypothetical protein
MVAVTGEDRERERLKAETGDGGFRIGEDRTCQTQLSRG